MATKFIIVAVAVAVCHAAPYTIIGSNYNRGAVLRNSQSPSIAYGFGSGFSSNVAGIRHSSGIGHSYQSGEGQAYGGGFANSDGAASARGVGIANSNANPSYITYKAQPAKYLSPVPHYGSAVSSAQNLGGFGSAVANSNTAGYGSASSSASNLRGLGYGSAIFTANNSGYGNAVSSAQTHGVSDYSSAVSASENVGGVRASTAHTIQQNGGAIQQSDATSYEGPGIQAAHSQAINTGYY